MNVPPIAHSGGRSDLALPIVETVTAQLAARIADYSTIGTIYSYNAGGYWQPTDTLRFRGQYSRSQRAPTITEFFSAPRQDFDGLNDPCDGLLPDGSGITAPPGTDFDPAVITANCQSEPGVQAYFADPDYDGAPADFDGSVYAPNAGNNMLKEETADTFTVGAVWAPAFAEDLTCEPNRGDVESPLFIFNHFLSTPFADADGAAPAAGDALVEKCSLTTCIQ